MRIALDHQHAGRPHKLSDLGAWGDLDHDGKRDLQESEAVWTAHYLHAAWLALRELGHEVVILSDGRYSDRHTRANDYGVDVYVACHLNSLTGGTRSGKTGNYGAVFSDHRSAPGNGLRLANLIAVEMTTRLPELSRQVRIWQSRPDDWTRRAYGTIAGVKSIGICYEPAFIDHASHRPLFSADGMQRIGASLANGIHSWGLSRALA